MNINKVPLSILALWTFQKKEQRMDVVPKPKIFKTGQGKMLARQGRFKPFTQYYLLVKLIKKIILASIYPCLADFFCSVNGGLHVVKGALSFEIHCANFA